MSGTEPQFLEVQRFRQWWMLVLLAGIFLASAWAAVQQVILGVPWGDNPAPDGWVVIIAAVFGVGLPAFILESDSSVLESNWNWSLSVSISTLDVLSSL